MAKLIENQTNSSDFSIDSFSIPYGIAYPVDTPPPPQENFYSFKVLPAYDSINHCSNSVNYRQSIFTGHNLPARSKQYINRTSQHNILISVTLLLSLCLLAIIYKQYKSKISLYIKACFSTRNLLQIKKDPNTLNNNLYFLSFLFSALITALLCLKTVQYFVPENPHGITDTVLFLISFGGIFFFWELKYIWGFCISFLFKDKEMFSHYTTHNIVSHLSYGFLLLPFVTFSYLSSSQFSVFFLEASLVLFVLFYLIYLFRSMIILFNVSKFSKLYLFLYLCTVEILPLLVIIKSAMNLF